MPFIQPMLASAMPDDPSGLPRFADGHWVAEVKYDGIRVVVEVGESAGDLFGRREVRVWSRYGKPRTLPSHILEVLRERFPAGTFDGELIAPGKRSYGTTALENAGDLVLVVFDLLDLGGRSTLDLPYVERRRLLLALFDLLGPAYHTVMLAAARPVLSFEDVAREAQRVWAEDGEGLILKKVTATYRPGKRPKEWVKIKQLRTAVLRLTGFAEGKMGPHSVWILTDDDGITTSVKWKDLAMLDAVEADPAAYLGRRVRIEYQERTPEGSYRHPRFDRWAEEGE